MRKDLLRGIVTSIPSFTKKNRDPDIPRFKEHVSWMVDQGLVEGKAVMMATGSLAAGYFMTIEEYKANIEALVDAANGKVPTMAAIFESGSREAVRRAKLAEDAGIDFLQIAPPHYMPPEEDEVLAHYKAISDNCNCGIMVYNTPWSAQYDMKTTLFKKLAKLDNVIAIKWTSHDKKVFSDTMRMYSHRFTFLDNTQHRIPLSYQLGAKGFVTMMGNITPKFELRLLDLLESKEYEQYEREFAKLAGWNVFQGETALLSPELRALRETTTIFKGVGEGHLMSALFEAMGRPIGPPILPQRVPSRKEVADIRRVLEKTHALELVELPAR
jgi:4-hydroxy-tetrahydrodipicolinate synthase